MKHAIALFGTASTGKSTVLRLVAERLANLAGATVHDWADIGRDVLAVLIVRGKRVGIASRGDTGAIVARDLAFLLERKCTIIVCATRTYGATQAEVERLKPKFTVEWIRQTPKGPNAWASANSAMAKRIIGKVAEAVDA